MIHVNCSKEGYLRYNWGLENVQVPKIKMDIYEQHILKILLVHGSNVSIRRESACQSTVHKIFENIVLKTNTTTTIITSYSNISKKALALRLR